MEAMATRQPSGDAYAEDDGLDVAMHGSFGGILSAAVEAQAIESKSPSEKSEGLETPVVAGAGYHLKLLFWAAA
jgi:hypothetical protein